VRNSDPKADAALIALDPHTGEIKARVGGRDYAQPVEPDFRQAAAGVGAY